MRNTPPPPLAPGQLPVPRTAGQWLWDNAGRFAPGLTTSTVLALARVWNANGAEHSVGDAAGVFTLAAASAGIGVVTATSQHGDSLASTTAFTISGALTTVAFAAYSAGLELPLLLWILSTAAVYVLAARYWREDRRAQADADRHYRLRSMERHYDVLDRDRDVQIAQAHAEAAQQDYAHQLAVAYLHKAGLDAQAARTVDDIRNERERHLRVVGE